MVKESWLCCIKLLRIVKYLSMKIGDAKGVTMLEAYIVNVSN